MKILDIKEVFNYKIIDGWNTYDGFIVTLENKILKLLISNGQSCCEEFGHIQSEDNLLDFIGSDLIKYELLDDGYDPIFIDKHSVNGNYCFDCSMINLHTSKGLLQFAVYNAHNGYYGHEIICKEEDISETEKY